MRTVLLSALIMAAPIPFPKPVVQIPIPLTRDTLVGDWVMHWGDTCYPITLTEKGTYSCSFGAVKYVGSWGLDWEGKFWITESSQPQAWQSYAVRLKPGTLTGKIEVGAPDVNFQLVKRKKSGRPR